MICLSCNNTRNCPFCKGKKEYEGKECPNCGGTGICQICWGNQGTE